MTTREHIVRAPQYQLGKMLILREWDGSLTRAVLEQVLNPQYPDVVIIRYHDGLKHKVHARYLATLVVGIWHERTVQMLSDGFDVPVVRRGWLQRVVA
jgi:hypothetical protein